MVVGGFTTQLEGQSFWLCITGQNFEVELFKVTLAVQTLKNRVANIEALVTIGQALDRTFGKT